MLGCGLGMLDIIFSRLHKVAHREVVNWVPWSHVMTAGMSNLLTHP
jgi:hypothetical protein